MKFSKVLDTIFDLGKYEMGVNIYVQEYIF